MADDGYEAIGPTGGTAPAPPPAPAAPAVPPPPPAPASPPKEQKMKSAMGANVASDTPHTPQGKTPQSAMESVQGDLKIEHGHMTLLDLIQLYSLLITHLIVLVVFCIVGFGNASDWEFIVKRTGAV